MPRGYQTPSASQLLTQAADPLYQPFRPWDSQCGLKPMPAGGDPRQPQAGADMLAEGTAEAAAAVTLPAQRRAPKGGQAQEGKGPAQDPLLAPKPQPDGPEFSV